MAGLENLFAAEPTLPSVQTTKLPDDMQQWAEVITTRLREQYPEVTRLPLVVEYRKKDPQSGTALGAVQVTSDGGKSIFVPFIVRKFELFPLDVWMEAKTQNVHPLTNDTFKEQFFVTSIAEGLDQRPMDAAGQYFNDPSLWTSNYPPLQGRYSYASAGYNILDQISDTITNEQKETFRKSIEENATSLVKFKKHANSPLEAIQKIAKSAAKPNTNDFAASASKLIPVGAISLKREGYDKYSLLSMADQLFDLSASEYMSREDCKNYLSKITPKAWDLMSDVDQEGEKTIQVKKAPEKGVWLYDDISDKPENATEFAVYETKNKAGMHITGVVFPLVVDFSGKKVSQKIFISAENGTMQPSIAGVKRENSEYFQKILKDPKGARVGQTGTFIFIDDGKAIATIPVTIKAIEKDFGPITAVKLNGEKIRITRGFGDSAPSAPLNDKKAKNFLDAHGMICIRPREYIIPRKMVWVPMEGFRDVMATPSEWMQKEAASHMDMDPMTIRWTGIVYDISGAGMDKISLDERTTKLLLATRGATMDKVSHIIKKAKASGRVKVHALQPLRKKADIEKLASETYASLEKICAELRTDFVKEAAEIDDAMTVDALLSLGFVNPENLSKFISFRPVFEKVLDYLAELTLAARLGLKDLGEGALVTAMGRLQEVVEGLKRVENGLKKPGIKTAAAKPAVVGVGAKLKSNLSHMHITRTITGKDVKHTASGIGKGMLRFGKKVAPIAVGAAIGNSIANHIHHKEAASHRSHGATSPRATQGAAQAEAKDQGLAEPMLGAGFNVPGQMPQGNPFADGMADGEMSTHMYLERHRDNPKAMLAYMNGKRLAEANKATAAMSIGMQPPKGMKPQSQKPTGKK